MYGTTFGNGGSGYGSVFKRDGDGTVTMLHRFTSIDGASPQGELIEASDGNFYGTTASGGSGRSGTVFRIDASGTVTTPHSFMGTDGRSPVAGVI